MSDQLGIYVAYAALGLMAVLPIYFGSHRTLEAVKSGGETDKGKAAAAPEPEKEHITSEDAKWFPVYGSGVLFSLYMLFKFVSQYYVNLIMTAYFSLLGVASLVNFLHPAVSHWLFRIHPQGDSFHLIFSRGLHGSNTLLGF